MTDPRAGFTREQIKALCAVYTGSLLAGREIAKTYGISRDRLYAILRVEKVPLRGRAFAVTGAKRRQGKKRTIASVFCGMTKDAPTDRTSLELAKTALRKRGMVVFDATVTDGSAGKGFVRCDGRLFTPAEIIQRAAQ